MMIPHHEPRCQFVMIITSMHTILMQLIISTAKLMNIQVDLKKLGISNFGELGSGMLGDCANDKLELKYLDRV